MKRKVMLKPEDRAVMEKLLVETLIPVRPRPEFVAGLRQKLVELKPEPPVLPHGWRTFLFSTAGIFGGLLVMGAVVRTLAGLVGMLNLVRQVRPTRPKRAASASPA